MSAASLGTLSGTSWLNDEVMDFSASHNDNNPRHDSPKMHFFNSFFFTKLKEKGYDGVRRWTRTIDLFSHDRSY